MDHSQIIAQTSNWIQQVVIGCNFCPFAKREVEDARVRYVVSAADTVEIALEQVIRECQRLDEDAATETTLLIFSNAFASFFDYLDLLEMATALINAQGYEGIYQLASFHPDYQFADAERTDASNYTNRSPYPMLHLLREASLERVLKNYPNPDTIPDRNIAYANELGVAFFQKILSGE